MSDEILRLVSSQGIWAVLSFILIYYILKAQEQRDLKQDQREKNYQDIISNLTNKFELIHSDLDELKKIIL